MVWMEAAETIWTGRQAGRGSVDYWIAGEALSLGWSGWKQQRPYGQAGRQAGNALSIGWQGKH
jgi:hypothetical protein